ncbi:MAG: hypothetical protein E6R14_06145 [Thermomicrobiales bacterium]|nr:MAG: hypothetical protein E6R14_06145 [Thermomicrobiales bacterium]
MFWRCGGNGAIGMVELLVTYRSGEVPSGPPLDRLLPLLVREVLAARIAVPPPTRDAVCAPIDDAYRLPEGSTARLATYRQQ